MRKLHGEMKRTGCLGTGGVKSTGVVALALRASSYKAPAGNESAASEITVLDRKKYHHFVAHISEWTDKDRMLWCKGRAAIAPSCLQIKAWHSKQATHADTISDADRVLVWGARGGVALAASAWIGSDLPSMSISVNTCSPRLSTNACVESRPRSKDAT